MAQVRGDQAALCICRLSHNTMFNIPVIWPQLNVTLWRIFCCWGTLVCGQDELTDAGLTEQGRDINDENR